MTLNNSQVELSTLKNSLWDFELTGFELAVHFHLQKIGIWQRLWKKTWIKWNFWFIHVWISCIQPVITLILFKTRQSSWMTSIGLPPAYPVHSMLHLGERQGWSRKRRRGEGKVEGDLCAGPDRDTPFFSLPPLPLPRGTLDRRLESPPPPQKGPVTRDPSPLPSPLSLWIDKVKTLPFLVLWRGAPMIRGSFKFLSHFRT